MKRILFTMLLAASLSAEAQTQTYETEFARPLNEVLTDIQNRFGVRLKYDIDTVGKVLSYADFRIRPYSVEESLTNVLAPFDYKFVKQKGNMYKLKAYEYPRRTDADGEKMLAYLNTLYTDQQSFQLRADSLKKEVRQRLGIDTLLAQCVMKDHNWHRGGYGKLTVTEILGVSSNVGTSSIIENFYGSNPQKFVDGLKRMSIDQPLHLQISGEGKPNIRGPKERYFSKTTLPWMSIGYETQVPPINILTFYNAIANNGVSIRPKFVRAAVRDGEVVKEYPTEIINPKICSDKTLAQIREILRKVVGEGLAKPAGSKQFHVSGKTGTAQVSQGAAGYKTGRTNYLVSFCGYFPSEEPKYSMIVSIQKPGLPASGGLMAGSVFSKIAERVYAKDLRLPLTNAIDTNSVVIPNVKAGEMREAQRVLEELEINIQGKVADSGKEVWGNTHVAPQAVVLESRSNMQNFVPSVIGMGAKDAVYLLESKGLKVNLVGVGKVKSQSIANGTIVKKGQTVTLTLK